MILEFLNQFIFLIMAKFLFVIIVILISSITASAKPSESNHDNFVLVGASPSKSKIKFEDNNKLRSAYYYPMMIAKPPLSDFAMRPAPHHSPNSILNLNLGLLEPFMLVTFLLFVINLIDKAKILHISRNEHLQSQDYENNPDPYYYIKRNSTV